MTPNEAFARLVGARLTSVQFVMDYLILGFDERGALTTLVWPEVRLSGGRLRFGDAGYRDALCSLIPQTTIRVEFDEQETLRCDFDGEASMFIEFGSDTTGGERGILTGPRHFLFVL